MICLETYIVDVSFYYGYLGWTLFFSICNYVAYENLTTISNHHIENALNTTRIRCGLDIFLLSYLLFIIENLCCILFKYVYVNLLIAKH
jgi:hypothetical protein